MTDSTYTDKIFSLSSPFDNEYQGKAHRMLFVCSAGLLRSPTAAAVAIEMGYNARSCGSAEYALIPLSANLIEWAETIYFVNERNYLEALDVFRPLKEYAEMIQRKAVVWDIPDCYNYKSPNLVNKIKELLA